LRAISYGPSRAAWNSRMIAEGKCHARSSQISYP
jgi:hypothetical protein